MTISHVFQVQVPPASFEAWRSIAAQVKDISARNGATPRWWTPVVGGQPGVMGRVTQFEDLQAYTTFNEKLSNDGAMRDLMPTIRSSGTQVVGTALNSDITSEVDDLEPDDSEFSVVQLLQLQIQPGQRGAWMETSAKIRAKSNELGLAIGRFMAPIVGSQPNVITGVTAHASLEAWAQSRQKFFDSGMPQALNEILAAQKTPSATIVGSAVMQEITDTI